MRPIRPTSIATLRGTLMTAALILGACGPAERDPVRDTAAMRIADVLTGAGDEIAGYAQADAVRPFTFPADHGPHPDFRTEWWYFTGNLRTDAGRRFGYHLTFFRSAVAPTDPVGESAWRSRQVWMAHFALVDPVGGQVLASERFERGALDLAGARATPFAVWLDDWRVDGTADGFAPLHLHATAPQHGLALDLELTPAKDIVLQGDQGLSRKSTTPGNASYYYSISRLDAAGTVRLADQEHTVHGSGWLDREWSTSALEKGQAGWDWFALQLDDGTELMWYRMRRDDGSTDPASEGVWIDGSSVAHRIDSGAVQMIEQRHWTSPDTGGRYPVAWTLRWPDGDLELQVEAIVDDQELDLAFRYWEGAVDIRGRRAGRDIRGVGYLEMTGYGER